MKRLLAILTLLALVASSAPVDAQDNAVRLEVQQAGTRVKLWSAGTARLNCSTGVTCTFDAVTGRVNVTASGGGSVSGLGTTDTVPKWTNGPGSILGDSHITDNGTNITLATPDGKVQIGDPAGAHNTTYLEVNDHFRRVTGSGQHFIFGDTLGSGNQTKIDLDDSASTIRLQAIGPDSLIELDSGGHAALMGDLNGSTGLISVDGDLLTIFITAPTITMTGAVGVTGALSATTVSGDGAGLTGIVEGGLSLSDVTTANASTSKHGFLRKLDNNAGHFLDGTGAWSTPPSVSGANPSASIGLSAVNGSASTFMRSDGAPALDQSIAPTWTGIHIWGSGLARMTSPRITTGINDANGNTALGITATTSAVNAVGVINSVTGTGLAATRVEIKPTGSDANISLSLSPKGTSNATQSRVLFGALGGFTLWDDGDWQLGNNAGSGFTQLRFAGAFTLSAQTSGVFIIKDGAASTKWVKIDSSRVALPSSNQYTVSPNSDPETAPDTGWARDIAKYWKPTDGSSGNGGLSLFPVSATPANPASSSEIHFYVKSNKLVIQYNDAGTVRYVTYDLTQSATSLWATSTSAP